MHNFWFYKLLIKPFMFFEGEEGGGGNNDAIDYKAKFEEQSKLISELTKKVDTLTKGNSDVDEEGEEKDEKDLLSRVRDAKGKGDKEKDEIKKVESDLRFNLTIKEFASNNKSLLPSEVEEVISAANNETYDSASEKASEIKSAIVSSFFQVQANIDLLTTSQKSRLEDFLKLTKNGRKEKASSIYENIFEPALETLRKVKKAEELNKSSGFINGTDGDNAYKQRLIDASKKAYIRK